jgi:hypothetical protein
MSRQPPSAGEIEAVRSELQRLGYLSHRVERYLLQDALRPERPLLTVSLLAAKVGVLGGALLALGAALLLAAWNPGMAASPFDLPVLVLHLLPPATLLFGGAFLALAGVLAAALRLRPGLRIDALSLAVGLSGGVALAALALWRGRDLVAPLSWPVVAAMASGGAAAAYLLGRLLYHGLLALAIRLTDRAPRRRAVVRRYVLPAAATVVLALLLLPAALAAHRPPVVAPGVIPAKTGDRLLLVGIDGVLPEELDYLLARGALPALGRLARDGARVTYERPDEPPAAFWITVATGLPSAEHGVEAVDSFRPVGMETALAVNGPFRPYWERVAAPLGLARHRALLATRRRAFTFWELLGRGGTPLAVVNWWGTYPATRQPGLVLAHGAYQLLAQSDAAAVSPPARAVEVMELRRGVSSPSEPGPSLAVARAALPATAAARLADVALLPDAFYREAAAREASRRPRALALYLPAIDLAADNWIGGDVALSDLIEAELTAADRLLAALLAGEPFGTVLVVVDPGRRAAGEGRALLWRAAGCAGEASLPPQALAAGLFRAAGLPQSAELPLPPDACRWPAPPARVTTFGRRDAGAAGEGARGDEYLQNLESLGYL